MVVIHTRTVIFQARTVRRVAPTDELQISPLPHQLALGELFAVSQTDTYWSKKHQYFDYRTKKFIFVD